MVNRKCKGKYTSPMDAMGPWKLTWRSLENQNPLILGDTGYIFISWLAFQPLDIQANISRPFFPNPPFHTLHNDLCRLGVRSCHMPCRKGLNDKGGGTLKADVSNEKFGHPRCLCHVFFRGWCHYVLPIFCIGDYFINPEISDPIIKKDPGCLAYIGDYTYYTTQLRITISQCKDPIIKPPVFHELQVSVCGFFLGVPNWQLLGPKSRPNWGTMVGDSVRPLRKPYLGGGWTNPFEKILVRQKWIISPGSDEHKRCLKPPPSLLFLEGNVALGGGISP